MAPYPPAFARLWGKKVHKRDALLERLTRELLDDDPRDAAAAKAWLSKWEDYASRSWTRQNTAQKSLLALKEAVAKGGSVSRRHTVCAPYGAAEEMQT